MIADGPRGPLLEHPISYIWSIKEKLWSDGPTINRLAGVIFCLLTLNRYEVMVLGLIDDDTKTVKKYDFSTQKWSHIADFPEYVIEAASMTSEVLQKKNCEKLYWRI